MRVAEEKYSIVDGPTGPVICRNYGRTTEYLGSDGYWVREAYIATPFARVSLAESKLHDLIERERRN